MGELRLERPFECTVLACDSSIGSQPISEPQVGIPLRVVDGDDMQMMRADLRRGFFHEEVAPLAAKIAAINVAKRGEHLPTAGDFRN